MGYQIDKSSDWQLLPWHKVNTRVVLLQRKIFEASKQYNLTKMYEMQNYLINSYEVRLHAVNQITYAINSYYKYENYSYNDFDKFNLFKYLFDNPKFIKSKLRLVIERIKEYLIYLCLKAEWQARFFDNLNYLNQPKVLDTKKQESKDYDIIISNYYWLYTIHSLKKLPYINTCIDYWIRNYYIIYDPSSNFKYLYYLLIYIHQLRFSWYSIKTKKIYYDNNINSLTLMNCNSIMQNCEISKMSEEIILINQIKTKIYNKDLLNRSRVNKNLSWNLIIYIMIREINKFFCRKLMQLNKRLIFYLLNQINYIMSYLKIGTNKQRIYNTLHSSQQSLYSILYRKQISIHLNLNLFKITR